VEIPARGSYVVHPGDLECHPTGIPATRTRAPDVVVVMCANCHLIDTGRRHDQRALPAPGRYRPRPDCLLDTIEKVLRCLAVFFEALARALISFAERLRVFIAGLDALAPTWRDQTWAQ
jgi:hypothetical protein